MQNSPLSHKKMVFIIAFYGSPASGKTTAAEFLVNTYGSLNIEHWEELPSSEELTCFSNSKLTFANIKVNQVTKPILVIESIESQLEADYIHGMGGVIVHVFRPSQLGHVPLDKGIYTVDYTIKNDMDKDTFLNRIHDNLSSRMDLFLK